MSFQDLFFLKNFKNDLFSGNHTISANMEITTIMFLTLDLISLYFEVIKSLIKFLNKGLKKIQTSLLNNINLMLFFKTILSNYYYVKIAI